MFKLLFAKANEDRSCIWSKKTATEVPSCPRNKQLWDKRAKMKNCESLAHKQNCTEDSNFKYHCVMNTFENAFIEVCAPVYKINGKFRNIVNKKVCRFKYSSLLLSSLYLACYPYSSETVEHTHALEGLKHRILKFT